MKKITIDLRDAVIDDDIILEVPTGTYRPVQTP